jgi:membrane protein
MDKKKTLMSVVALLIGALFSTFSLEISAQKPERIQFCDRNYNYGIGNDTIEIFFNVFGAGNKRLTNLTQKDFEDFASFYEDGKLIENPVIKKLSSGIRIPKEFTFSILLDKSIPQEGKTQILKSIKKFVDIAPDSCVYVSFYGDEVSNTVNVNKNNFAEIEQQYLTPSTGKTFYSGIHAKLAEFSTMPPSFLSDIHASGYSQNPLVSRRATANPGKNLLLVFAEGSTRPDDELLDFITMTDYQSQNAAILPKVYAFYYTAEGEDVYIKDTLIGLTHPKDSINNDIKELTGIVSSSSNMNEVLSSFQQVIENATYDYVLKYKVGLDRIYNGTVTYKVDWGNHTIGEVEFTVGSAERPWPEREQSAVSYVIELLAGLVVTVLTFAFFFFVMKVLVPYIQSIGFRSKYYKKYQPEENVQRRICHYCKQDLKPGQIIVTKCNHWMHKHCWIENGYKCAELGQNCKTGIQNHVEWKDLWSKNALKDCSQTIAGILAGFISWVLYEIFGRGGFGAISKFIVGLVFKVDDAGFSLMNDCIAKTSSFLMIGLLLGFFISLVFRYKDDVRDKNWKIWLKIIGLSVMGGVIGMLAFAIGAYLFCLILSWTDNTYIPWYCSLPAYIIFSISVSLALTIKSTIPVKSALLGGLLSSIIGFLVLYFTKFTSARYEWLNMLLNFVIYGGGLGASLVTVRMLAERYFLVIQNGVKAGQRIPIHKWMNATGGGNKVSIGMTGECEIQMNWEKSNKVAKEHAQLYIDYERNVPVIKPLAPGVIYNSRAELPVNRPAVLSNGDTFKIGDTIFRYEEA